MKLEKLLLRFSENEEKVAFIHEGRRFKYSEVLAKIAIYENFLENQSVQEGDTVVVVGDYSPEIFCFLLSLVANKNIVVPLTYDSVVEKDKVIRISEAQWYVEFSDDISQIKLSQVEVIPSNPLKQKLTSLGEPGVILFSSGSTGEPKGMLHNFNTVLNKFEKQRSPVTAIVFLMLDHFGGINTLLGITASLGTVVTVKDRSVKTICQAIETYKVELLPTTPSFLNMMVHTGANKTFNLSSLKKITYGTEVMPQATLDRLRQVFPEVAMQQTYGLSELGVLSSKSKPDGSLWVKVGGAGFKIDVREGILWIKSEFAMMGYINAENPFDSDGWFNTQDRVEVDGDYLKILGRVTDLINVGGQKVYPSEIEDVIVGLDNIEDVAVFSESNPLLGKLIVAKIKLVNPESVSSLKKRVRHECMKKMASYKVPAKVVISDKSMYSSRMKKKRMNDKSENPVTQ